MKLTLYALLGYVSFIGGSTIKKYIEINAAEDAMYAPIFAIAGAFVAMTATTTTLYVNLRQYGKQDMLSEVLGQELVMKVAVLGAAGGLGAMAIVKLAFAGS
jgi:uncharacterized membrane protein YdjX (TVP38/TMEM64 family)